MTRLSPFPQTIFLSLIGILLLTIGCKQTEESKVKEAANQYMQGRIKLEKSGDTLQLKSVTEPLLFRFIKLNEEYVKIIDAPVMKEDLARISVGEVRICYDEDKLSIDLFYEDKESVFIKKGRP